MAMPHDALVLDLSLLKGVTVDRASGHARVLPGVLLGEMDVELQKFELAVPSGQVSTTGVTGLALGGGIGYLTRRFGLTIDCIEACELVTPDGQKVRATVDMHPELLWGLKGAGHNFGVVTAIEFRTHHLDRNVATGFIAFPIEQAIEILERLNEHMLSAPLELCVIPLLLRLPAIPGLPLPSIGQTALLFNIVYTGPTNQADRVFETLAGMGKPIFNQSVRSTWVEANSRADALLPWGNRTSSYAGHLPGLSRPLIAALVAVAQKQPSASHGGLSGAIALPGMGGAVDDVSEGSSVYSRAGAKWMWEVLASWTEPERDAEFVSWLDDVRSAVKPFMLKSGYINLSVNQGPEWLVGVYGGVEKYRRLVSLKTKWDPTNMFRFNKNILPLPGPQ